MASFSLFPKIETDEERQRRQERLLKKPAKTELSSSSAEPTPSLQRQPSNPSLQSRTNIKTTRSAPQQRKDESVAPTLPTGASSPGLYELPTPRTDPLPAPPKQPSSGHQRASPSKTSQPPAVDPAVVSSDSTPTSATTRSSSSAFSRASTTSSSYSVTYPAVPTAQSPIIKPSPPKEHKKQKSSLASLPPPPPLPLPLPSNKMLARANTTATNQSASTLRSGASSTTNASTIHTLTKANRATTYAGAARSIFPVFDPSRPFAEQQREYTLAHQPTATYRRALTRKALEESQHEFSAPPSYRGPRSVGSGITRVSTAPSFKSSYPIKQRSSVDLLQRRDDDKKHAGVGVTASTTLIVSHQQQLADPSTSSLAPVATKQKDPGDSQHGVAAALDACAFVFGVGVEVVGGAVGGLRRGVRKERAKRQRRDDRRASKKAGGQKEVTKVSEEEVDKEEEQVEEYKSRLAWPRRQQQQQRSPSPGWVVGEGGPRRVTDFRI